MTAVREAPGTAIDRARDAGARVVVSERDSVTQLLQTAVERGTPVEQLEKLVDLHERMEIRQARRDFMAALAAFQKECPPVQHNKTAKIATKSGGTYSFTYAELDEIARTISPILAKHGLSYGWDSTVEKDSLTCICTIRHEGGHSESSRLTLPVENPSAMNPQQKVGAALTFAQRRTLTSALGMTTTDQDPDVAGADPTPITMDEATHIADLLTERKIDRARFLKYMGVESVEAIRAVDYTKAIAALDEYQRKAHARGATR